MYCLLNTLHIVTILFSPGAELVMFQANKLNTMCFYILDPVIIINAFVHLLLRQGGSELQELLAWFLLLLVIVIIVDTFHYEFRIYHMSKFADQTVDAVDRCNTCILQAM